MNKITAQIDGMMCSMCESHVNEALRKAFHVKKVTSSHTKGETVLLTEDPVTEAQLRAALAPTGYTVGTVKVEEGVKKGLFGYK